MRYRLLSTAIGAATLSTGAYAQEAARTPDQTVPAPVEPTAAKPTIDFSASVIGVTDYRFRGLSQTDKRPAIQGTFTLAHKSGFYASVWSSTISNYISNRSPTEIDLSGGYKRTTADGTSFDVGMLYYFYPSNDGINSDFFEPYANIAHAVGPITAKVGTNFGWKQHALGLAGERRKAFYAYGELSGTVPHTGVSLTGHFGRSFERNYITFGQKYNDYSLTAAYTYKIATLSVAYVNTNKDLDSYPLGGGRNRDISNGGIVGSLAFAF